MHCNENLNLQLSNKYKFDAAKWKNFAKEIDKLQTNWNSLNVDDLASRLTNSLKVVADNNIPKFIANRKRNTTIPARTNENKKQFAEPIQ